MCWIYFVLLCFSWKRKTSNIIWPSQIFFNKWLCKCDHQLPNSTLTLIVYWICLYFSHQYPTPPFTIASDDGKWKSFVDNNTPCTSHHQTIIIIHNFYNLYDNLLLVPLMWACKDWLEHNTSSQMIQYQR